MHPPGFKTINRREDLHLYTLQGHSKNDPILFGVSPLPYSRKPGLVGPDVSIFPKGVSRGVHNIAFLLSPDHFCVFDFVFFQSLVLNIKEL